MRLCVDYRQLNSKTQKDAFPLPCIEESLDALSGAHWFSTLDLASGYNQVPVTEGDRPKTAFCTPFGLFEWNRMPFGLCNILQLGFASYYRWFVEGFAKLAALLHRVVAQLAGKRSKRVDQSIPGAWTEECQQSFEALKTKLTTAPVLVYANFSLPFVLAVDASHGGLGAVLSQEQEGKVRPIAYASRGLRPTERNMSNYSSMKLELLALK